VALVGTDVSEEPGASLIRVTKIGALGTTQEPHGVTTQKTPFFIVTAVKTSNLTTHLLVLMIVVLVALKFVVLVLVTTTLATYR
jgi:hypothetical protein